MARTSPSSSRAERMEPRSRNDRHHVAAEDDFTASVRGNLQVGPETARLRALLSLSLASLRQAAALELANDLAALQTPGLLDGAELRVVRERVRKALCPELNGDRSPAAHRTT